MSIRNFWKGLTGELRGSISQALFLDSETYHCFWNVIVPTQRGSSQIDHVIVSRFGIFVIEVKNRSGSIYGNEREAKWTQVLGRVKHSIENPLRQNFGHMKALEEFLRIEPAKMHSVVSFVGDCTFKTPMPENVLCGGHVTYVKGKTAVLMSEAEVAGVARAIQQLRDGARLLDGWRHAESVRARYASSDTCPKCGSPLKRRVARRGATEGTAFLGCSRYPRCRYTRPA